MRQVIGFGIVFLVSANAMHAQDILNGTKDTPYRKITISHDNLYLLALISGRKEDGGVVKEMTVHFFNRAKQSKETLVSFSAREGILSSVGFSPTGEDMVVGGRRYFGAWNCPGKACWFMRKGEQDEREAHTVDAFVAPRKGSKIAYAVTRYKVGELNEGKVMLWDVGESSLHDVFRITDSKNPRMIFFAFRLALSNSGDRLAHWNVETKQLVVHDTAKYPFKDLTSWDSKLENVHHIAFAEDEKSVWLLADQKLWHYDFGAKRVIHSIDVGDAAWFHPLTDGPLMVYRERTKENAPFVRFIDPKNKSDKCVELGIDVWAVTLSPDQTLFAGCGVEAGIYFWNVNELRKKAKPSKREE